MAKMERSSVIAIILVFVGICAVLTSSEYNKTSSQQTKRILVELLIVCDKGFSDHFQNDRQKIIDYWAIYMWELNMKFKSLSKSDISFQLTHLITVNQTIDQPFIENAREINGSLILRKTIRPFSSWLYDHQDDVSNFDIAVLVTSDQRVISTYSSWSYTSGLCEKSTFHKKHWSVFTAYFKHPWRRPFCSILEFPLSFMLGSGYDTDKPNLKACGGNNYIMDRVQDCQENRYFFSTCSDAGIANGTKSYEARCLRKIDDDAVNIIEKYSQVAHPPSIEEQCKLLTDDSSAIVKKNNCVQSNCYKQQNGSLTLVQTFYPFDNSPCGVNKFCFRGRCISRGCQIMNVASGKCLQQSNRFVCNDYPKMTECVKLSTPLEQLRIQNKQPIGIFLMSPYSSVQDDENTDKCLSVDLKDIQIRYSKCSMDKDFLLWNLIQVGGSKQEFLLSHASTNTCAVVDSNRNLKAIKNCNDLNKHTRWKFYEPFTIPEGMLKTAKRNLRRSDFFTKSTAMQIFLGLITISALFVIVCVMHLNWLKKIKKRLLRENISSDNGNSFEVTFKK